MEAIHGASPSGRLLVVGLVVVDPPLVRGRFGGELLEVTRDLGFV